MSAILDVCYKEVILYSIILRAIDIGRPAKTGIFRPPSPVCPGSKRKEFFENNSFRNHDICPFFQDPPPAGKLDVLNGIAGRPNLIHSIVKGVGVSIWKCVKFEDKNRTHHSAKPSSLGHRY